MGTGTRVAPKPFTVTIPGNHPVLFNLGGQAFHEAASDLVDRVRKAAAVASIEHPATRAVMERYQQALSTTEGPGELVTELRAQGVTEFHGTDYGDLGKPLSTLLRECADQIDRTEASRIVRPTGATGVALVDVTSAIPVGKSARKVKAPSPNETRRQPGLKLPIKGGKVQSTGSVGSPHLQTPEVVGAKVRRKAVS